MLRHDTLERITLKIAWISFTEVPGVIWLIIKALDTPPSEENWPFLSSPTLRPTLFIEEGDMIPGESMSAPRGPDSIRFAAVAWFGEDCNIGVVQEVSELQQYVDGLRQRRELHGHWTTRRSMGDEAQSSWGQLGCIGRGSCRDRQGRSRDERVLGTQRSDFADFSFRTEVGIGTDEIESRWYVRSGSDVASILEVMDVLWRERRELCCRSTMTGLDFF